jgi:hypothetical protein
MAFLCDLYLLFVCITHQDRRKSDSDQDDDSYEDDDDDRSDAEESIKTSKKHAMDSDDEDECKADRYKVLKREVLEG